AEVVAETTVVVVELAELPLLPDKAMTVPTPMPIAASPSRARNQALVQIERFAGWAETGCAPVGGGAAGPPGPRGGAPDDGAAGRDGWGGRERRRGGGGGRGCRRRRPGGGRGHRRACRGRRRWRTGRNQWGGRHSGYDRAGRHRAGRESSPSGGRW